MRNVEENQKNEREKGRDIVAYTRQSYYRKMHNTWLLLERTSFKTNQNAHSHTFQLIDPSVGQ